MFSDNGTRGCINIQNHEASFELMKLNFLEGEANHFHFFQVPISKIPKEIS